MRSHIVRIGAIALIASSLASCSDERSNPLAPKAPNDMTLGSPIGTVPPILTVASPDDFVEISAGGSNTCARKRNGDVYCWGSEAGTSRTPTIAYRGAGHIAVGSGHSCFLDGAGAVFCRGAGGSGQLGIQFGAFPSSNAGFVIAPVDPSTGLPQKFSSVSAGASSTCGMTSIGVYCWGEQGHVVQVIKYPTGYTGVVVQVASVPTLITSPQGYSNTTLASIAIGNSHSCAIEPAGNVECWGLNNYGQAGANPQTWPAVPFPESNLVWHGFAVRAAVAAAARRVSAQQDFTCADLVNETVQCFGRNLYGQLGNGRSGDGTETSLPQTVGGGLPLHGVTTGSQHACALDANSEAWCWGYDFTGQLGNGSQGNAFPFLQKVDPVSLSVDANGNTVTWGKTVAFRNLAAGAKHTCGIGTDNHIYCWGDNTLRQLGTDIFQAPGVIATIGFSPNPVLTM
jgi:alpha-tubulin suppressor-like RCC1 family protein